MKKRQRTAFYYAVLKKTSFKKKTMIFLNRNKNAINFPVVVFALKKNLLLS